MLNRISGSLRTALALPVGYGGAVLLTSSLSAVLGTTALLGAVLGLIFGGWIGFVGSYLAPSPRWRPALFFFGLTLFISWPLLRGDAPDYWTARSRAALAAAIVGGVVAIILDRRERRAVTIPIVRSSPAS